MLYEICKNLRNYFESEKIFGKFEIKDGNISPSLSIKDGQYFRIIGSVMNDGIYKKGEEVLIDEEFEGAVWLLSIPREFLNLVKEIEEFQKKCDATPFQSESFGGYSYSKSSADVSYKTVFRNRLNTWRKI